MVADNITTKKRRGPTAWADLTSLVEGLARIEEKLQANVNLLGRLELQYNERIAKDESQISETCVTADTALFEARNNTDRIDLLKWVIGGITVVLSSALAIILNKLLRI